MQWGFWCRSAVPDLNGPTSNCWGQTFLGKSKFQLTNYSGIVHSTCQEDKGRKTPNHLAQFRFLAWRLPALLSAGLESDSTHCEGILVPCRQGSMLRVGPFPRLGNVYRRDNKDKAHKVIYGLHHDFIRCGQ